MNSDIQVCTPEQKALIEYYYQLKYATMLSVANRMLNDITLAETAVQETFLIAMRIPNKFCESPNREAWLYSVMKNIIRHLWRDKANALKHTIAISDVPESELSHEDALPELRLRSIADDDDFKLLAYYYVYGYSMKELADKKEISIGACKMRIKRARDRLREKLK